MVKKSINTAAMGFDESGITIELIGVAESSSDAEIRSDRVEKLVAKIIILGQTKRRSIKEGLDEIQVAA